MRLMMICIVAAAALSLATTGRAQDVMVVKLAGVNLTTDAGARIALQRIKLAARQFCGQPDMRMLAEQSLTSKCMDGMMDKAVDKLAAPRVTALYAPVTEIRLARSGR